MSSRPRPNLDRYLLGAVTALIVARTLTPGDDPGRLRLTTTGGPLTFNLCVFLVFILASVRAIFARRSGQIQSLIVPVMLVGVGCVAIVGPGIAGVYAKPGLYWAWEWVVLGTIFLLVRMTCLRPSDASGLANAIVATAVSVAALAIYQGIARQTGIATGDTIIPESVTLLAGTPEHYRHINEPESRGPHPHGTFGSAEALVAFLLLALPLASIAWRYGTGRPGGTYRFLVPLAIMLALIMGLLAISFVHKPDEWREASRLISEHWARGVGAGNYSRFSNGPFVPGGFWPGLLASVGLVGAGLFGLAVLVGLKSALTGPIPIDEPSRPEDGPRWELYVGGMAGLCLGFIWMAGAIPAEAPPSEVVRLGGIALVRAIIWFGALAAMESLRLPNRLVIRGAILGLVLVAIFGVISDSVARPTTMVPAIAMLSLAVCVRRPTPVESTRRIAFLHVEMALAAVGMAIAFVITAAAPGWSTARAVREARLGSRLYPELLHKIEIAPQGGPRATARTNARAFLNQHILAPLVDAVNREPDNATLRVEVARWRRMLWDLQLVLDPKAAGRAADDTIASLKVAQQFDPRHPGALRMEFEALMQFRRGSERNADLRVNELLRLIEELVARDPSIEVQTRYRLVVLLLDDRELTTAIGRKRSGISRMAQLLMESRYSDVIEKELTTLLRQNRAPGAPYGQITDAQRSALIERGLKAIFRPSVELLEEWTQ